MTISGAGEIVFGLSLAILAGALNGSWNASFSPSHGLAVGRRRSMPMSTTTQRPTPPSTSTSTSTNAPPTADTTFSSDLTYPLAWIAFQTYAAIINIPICISWAGGIERVQYIVGEADNIDLMLVCIFSILWGAGSVGFGIACQIAGVGLGTNLCMGVIMVLGTFLPLCLDGAIVTGAGGMVLTGLVICCSALLLTVQSLHLRDSEETTPRRCLDHATKSTIKNMIDVKDLPDSHNDIEKVEEQETELKQNDKVNNSSSSKEHSTLYKVGVCIIAGIFAAQLQFAFVFGDRIVDIAESSEGPGSTPPSGTSAVIWLFAISLGTPVSIIYGWYNKGADVSWSCLYQCPWYRHLLVLMTTSVPWVSHIHLYGYSNTLLPDDLAASVAWPILMMTTVFTGMIWSIVLGEWKCASALAKRKLYQGLTLVTLGVGIIMSSIALG